MGGWSPKLYGGDLKDLFNAGPNGYSLLKNLFIMYYAVDKNNVYTSSSIVTKYNFSISKSKTAYIGVALNPLQFEDNNYNGRCGLKLQFTNAGEISYIKAVMLTTNGGFTDMIRIVDKIPETSYSWSYSYEIYTLD